MVNFSEDIANIEFALLHRINSVTPREYRTEVNRIANKVYSLDKHHDFISNTKPSMAGGKKLKAPADSSFDLRMFINQHLTFLKGQPIYSNGMSEKSRFNYDNLVNMLKEDFGIKHIATEKNEDGFIDYLGNIVVEGKKYFGYYIIITCTESPVNVFIQNFKIFYVSSSVTSKQRVGVYNFFGGKTIDNVNSIFMDDIGIIVNHLYTADGMGDRVMLSLPMMNQVWSTQFPVKVK